MMVRLVCACAEAAKSAMSVKAKARKSRRNLKFRSIILGSFGKFGCGILFRLHRSVYHAALDLNCTVGSAQQTRTAFCFKNRVVREELAVRTDLRIGPGPRRGAMQHVQTVFFVELDLRFVIRNGMA